MASFQELQREGAQRLVGKGIDTAALDARVLLAFATGLSHEALVSQAYDEVPTDQTKRFGELIDQRCKGVPVARLIGSREFWGMEFQLSPETLVPRPDSECVVEALLEKVEDKTAPHRILDLGTGSGCLLVALLSELTNATGVGVDQSEGAVATARKNAESSGLGSRSDFAQSDWGANAIGPFDLIISNPPYIPSDEVKTLDVEVRDHDPESALDGGSDGLDDYRRILEELPRLAKLGAWIAFETSPDLYTELFNLVDRAGFVEIAEIKDLAGRQRGLTFRQP